ncbi:MAG TPA: ABC transporter ATP-binding protein [Trebonia sp.]|jgi:peptide/nickel transport system ATP-binding protein|nr:ABC transporter ATP-binding protein [Trebonia sp.]
MTAETTPGAPGPAAGAPPALLSVSGLTCELPTPAGPVRPVEDVSFTLGHGKTLGIVGESGAGKSMLARALMGLVPRGATLSGDVVLDGVSISRLTGKDRRKVLGAGIGLVFQDPMTSLNPVVPIGRQITEGMRFHKGIKGREARGIGIDLLRQVGVNDPAKRYDQYPHQLSGGMRQRVTIAAALACDPKVLIADEATTALDVTVQKQILDLLQSIQRDREMGLVIITHDLGVVAGRTDGIAVMYAGQVVEKGPTAVLFDAHRNRYTAALLRSMPRLEDEPHQKLATIAGAPPQPRALPPGCRFAPRCGFAQPECSQGPLELVRDAPGHHYRCVNPREVPAAVGDEQPYASATGIQQ